MYEHTLPASWLPISTGDTAVGVAERDALGTTARVAVWPPENLQGAVAAVDVVLEALDQQASRFRSDSEISWVHRKDGGMFLLSDGLADLYVPNGRDFPGRVISLVSGLVAAMIRTAAIRTTSAMPMPMMTLTNTDASG